MIRRVGIFAMMAALSLLSLERTSSGAAPPPEDDAGAPPALGSYIVLSWNDLGMHCMNPWHLNLSVLPPFNNVYAQVIRRGDALSFPQVVNSGVTLSYSIPGNTTSVTKTDFWTYDQALFGVDLPPDVGLAGKGLAGTLDPVGEHFQAIGIPLTPFTDAAPTVEDPYQQGLILLTDDNGVELARSTPVVPVSVELRCVSSGCHASEDAIINGHELAGGFDPNARPILCAGCHADPALGTPGIGDAGYFSFRMHDQHKFMDEQFSGTALCYKCHPGLVAQCLRGTMATDWGLQCQECHGSMNQVASSIEQGRVPWLNEPSCGSCHTARFGEPAGQLFRQSTGHGGVMCSGCHGSPHAIFPTREPRDNANMVSLQGHTGTLTMCSVCHGVTPDGAGPHGRIPSGVPGQEIAGGGPPLSVSPNPAHGRISIEIPAETADGGTLVVFDAQGRTVRLLTPSVAGTGRLNAEWDGTGKAGSVAPGVYFVRWMQNGKKSGVKIVLMK